MLQPTEYAVICVPEPTNTILFTIDEGEVFKEKA